MKYPNLIDQFEMIMQHVQDENYPEATATVATFKMRLADFEEELQKAREKVSEYQYANAHLHAEIGEFKEGLPTEKAKELDEVLIMDWEQSSSDGQLWRSYKKAEVAVVKWTVVPFLNWAGEHHWFDENNGVIYKNPKAFFAPPALPSTEAQMEGE